MANKNNVYACGASNGIVIGVLMAATFLLQGYAGVNLALILVGDVLLISTPFVLYRQLVRDYDRVASMRSFSGIWLDGIITFLCGSLILAVVVYVFCRFLRPTWFVDTMNIMVSSYREIGTPDAANMADLLESTLKQAGMPTPIQMALSMVWLTGFLGSMLSLAEAFIIKYITRRKRNNDGHFSSNTSI